MIPIVTVDEAKDLIKNPTMEFRIVKIKSRLNIDFYKKLVHKVEDTYEYAWKDGTDTYQAISLQYNDEKNKLYDGVPHNGSTNPSMWGAKMDGLQDRSKKNEIGEMFQDWFDYLEETFSGMHIFRTRILKTHPGHVAPPHVDEPACRIHLPLQTHYHNIMFFGSDPYHLRADGSIYLCNTGSIEHSFANFSDTSRTHIVSCIRKEKIIGHVDRKTTG
jgi:hypothetical protein